MKRSYVVIDIRGVQHLIKAQNVEIAEDTVYFCDLDDEHNPVPIAFFLRNKIIGFYYQGEE